MAARPHARHVQGVISAILVPLIVFWYLRSSGVKAFFAR
jgi:hypothetical protein